MAGSRRRGLFIALEGGEAAGKSTQARTLADALGAVLTREPGGTVVGAAIRALVLDGAECQPMTEALLMAADRAEHLATVVRPSLDAGRDVVTDRSSGSFWAYQGWGRELGFDLVHRLDQLATGGLEPDLFVLLDVAVAQRQTRREGAADRLERESVLFHERVEAGFRELARRDLRRWCVVDGDAEPADVAEAIASAVERVRAGGSASA